LTLALDRPEVSEAGRAKTNLGGLALTALLLALASIPFLYLVQRVRTISGAELQAILLRPKTLEIILNTFTLAIVVATLSVLIGTLFASLIFSSNFRSRGILLALSALPLAIPSYVFTYCWIAIWPSFRGFWAAALVLTLSTMPYILLAAFAALRRIDRVQVDVARSLGCNRFQVFTRIILPQIRNSIAASTLLVILYVFSDFGAVSLLGVDTFTRAIQNLYRASFDRQSAAFLGLILVLFAAILILAEERMQRRTIGARSTSRIKEEIALITKRAPKALAFTAIIAYSLLALAVPAYVLVTRMVDNFQGIEFASLIAATFNTVLVASLGATIAILFALPLAWTIISTRNRFALATEKVVLITHALPGVVLGLSLVAFSSEIPWLYQSIALLAFAYALLFLAKGVGATRTSIERVPQGLKEVATTLGVSPWETMRRVTIPLAAPGIGVGFLLILLTAMKELPATLMLRPTGFDTLAIEIWSAASINRFNEAAPYALLLILIAAIPTFILSRPDRQFQDESKSKVPNQMRKGGIDDIS
jgi:iron(III) transport system permease protein